MHFLDQKLFLKKNLKEMKQNRDKEIRSLSENIVKRGKYSLDISDF